MTTPRHEYKEGAPCWVDLATPDLDGARRFYGALFGWTLDPPSPQFAGYVNARIDGEVVAGVMPMPDRPSGWGVWLSTRDIDAATRRLVDAGGTPLMPKHAVGSLGSMLMATDAVGATVGLWQPGDHRGSARFDVHGAMCWHELYTRDGAAADRFYRALFGYQQHAVDTDKGFNYAMYDLDGQTVCGRLQMTAAWGDIPAHWLTYFAVSDLEAALACVRAQGGKVLHGPTDSPHGPNATVTDPFGAVLAVIQRPASR